jgi:hypothetical protein
MQDFGVQGFILSRELVFDGLINVISFEHPFVWCLYPVIYSPVAFLNLLLAVFHYDFSFLHQFKCRLKEVQVEPEDFVQLVHGFDCLSTVITLIADILSDDHQVTLLDVAVVVFLVGPTPRWLDVVGLKPRQGQLINELTAAIRVGT